MLARVAIGVVLSLLVAWGLLIAFLLRRRPTSQRAREAMRLLPDTLRLLRRSAVDRSLPRGVRWRLWLLLGYLASPVDLVPDFLPVVGYADDVIIAAAVLRSVARRAGPDAIRRNWPGTQEGLAALWGAIGLPGAPDA